MNKILTKTTLILFIFLSMNVGAATLPSPEYSLPKPETCLPAPHLSATKKLRSSGFYFGANVGYQAVTPKFNNLQSATVLPLTNVPVDVSTPFVDKTFKDHLTGSIYTGYMFKYKQLFFAIDGLLSFNDRNGMLTDVTHNHLAAGALVFEIQLRTQTEVQLNRLRPGIEIRPGINISDRFSLFLLFGMLYDRVQLNTEDTVTTRDVLGNITVNDVKTGISTKVLPIQFGLGILFAMTPDVYLTLEDRYTIYPEVHMNIIGPTETAFGIVPDGLVSENNIKIYNNNVLIGLLFKIS